jgi:outer membrane protein assembly factor BamB
MDHDARVELHVLDGATGSERWSTGLGVMTGLPLVDGTRLVLDTGGVGTRGSVVAFDLETGVRRWTTPVAGSSEVGEGGIVDGDRIVLVDGLGTVTALDRATGRRQWAHDLHMPVFHGRPIAIDHALVLRDIAGEIHVLDRRTGRRRGGFRINGLGVGLGGGAAGLVFARSQVSQHQVVGLPRAMLTMRTGTGTPPVPVAMAPDQSRSPRPAR